MKTIQQFVDELKEEGVAEDEIRHELTSRLQEAIANRIKLAGPPPPHIVNGVGQEHLGALFGYVISLIYAASTDAEIERVLNDFQEFRDFDIAARHYQALFYQGEEG